jgi:hypothetical protein
MRRAQRLTSQTSPLPPPINFRGKGLFFLNGMIRAEHRPSQSGSPRDTFSAGTC